MRAPDRAPVARSWPGASSPSCGSSRTPDRVLAGRLATAPARGLASGVGRVRVTVAVVVEAVGADGTAGRAFHGSGVDRLARVVAVGAGDHGKDRGRIAVS